MKTELNKSGTQFYSDKELSQLLRISQQEIQDIRNKHIERLNTKGLSCPINTFIDGKGPYCQEGCLHWYVSHEKQEAFRLLYRPIIEEILENMDMDINEIENAGIAYMYIETLKGVALKEAVKAGIGNVVSDEIAESVKEAIGELNDAMDDLENTLKKLGL